MNIRTTTAVVGLAAALTLTACGGSDATSDGGNAGDAPANTSTEVTLLGTDSLKYDITELSVAADEEVTFTLTSEGAVAHNIVIEELDDLMVVEAAGGETATGTATFEAGTYTYYCDIPGHRQAGMEGTLTAG